MQAENLILSAKTLVQSFTKNLFFSPRVLKNQLNMEGRTIPLPHTKLEYGILYAFWSHATRYWQRQLKLLISCSQTFRATALIVGFECRSHLYTPRTSAILHQSLVAMETTDVYFRKITQQRKNCSSFDFSRKKLLEIDSIAAKSKNYEK